MYLYIHVHACYSLTHCVNIVVQEIERYEVERVSTVKKCMQVFGR